jgi:hypothetical protein
LNFYVPPFAKNAKDGAHPGIGSGWRRTDNSKSGVAREGLGRKADFSTARLTMRP